MEEVTAFHEAGHAFVAVMAGARVVSVTIEPDEDERYGDTEVAWSRSQFSDREFAEKLALVALAGPVTEMVMTGDRYHPALLPEWSADWAQAMNAASALFSEEAKQVEFLERMTIETHSILSRDDVWSFIGAIVDELVAHETLEGETVHEIVDQWMRLHSS